MYIRLSKSGDSYTIDKTIKEIDEYSVNFGLTDIVVMFEDDSELLTYANLYKNEDVGGTSSGALPKTVLYFRAWLSETELVDITITMQSADNTVIPPVTVEKKSIIPAALPNPNKLTFEGAVTAEYDGSGAVTVSVPEGTSTLRIEKTAQDTTTELDPNKLYIFPEMASLTYTLATPSETSIANEYHFIFQSGATATELVHPANVSVPDGFAVEKNKVYEISILEGCLAYQSWAVN